MKLVGTDTEIYTAPYLEIARNKIEGIGEILKFGKAEGIQSADGFVNVWDGVNDANAQNGYTYSTEADIDSISSSNSGDDQDVEVQGLDANWQIKIQTVTLNGQNRVALTYPLVRVFRMKNVGTTDFAGSIYCYVNGDITDGVPDTNTDIRAIVQGDYNQTLMALYTIPAGKTGYLTSVWGGLAIKIAAASIFHLKARPFGGVFQMKYAGSVNSTGSSYFEKKYKIPLSFPEKTDLMVESDSSANGVSVSAGYDVILEDN